MSNKKLWSGRFDKDVNQLVLEFTESISFDKRLALYDIKGSIAHIKMLAHCNIINEKEKEKIIKGLKKIERLILDNKFNFSKEYEDIHLNIENYLIKSIGEVGKKLHTARSRNDQVLVDIYLYLRDSINNIISILNKLLKEIVSLAEKNLTIIIPGYTHLQQAQPVLFSHYIMAYFFKFNRDRERFINNLKSVEILPLGVGALAGVNYKTDRKYLAKLLGFKRVSENSIDTVSNRDFLIEFIFNSALTALHISRLSEDFIIFNSEEFKYIEIDDAFTTGSSIMPNKKNPDVFELLRGKSAKIYGDLMSIFTLLKALPLSYNRDLQEDKKILFETEEYITAMLSILKETLNNIKVNQENIFNNMRNGFTLATDIADYLVKNNIPFRQAHTFTGKLIKFCENKGKSLFELKRGDLKNILPLKDKELDGIFAILDYHKSVNSKESYGATSRKSVLNQIKKAKKMLNLN